MSVIVGLGHLRLRLIAGVAENDDLIPWSGAVDAHCDVGRLLVDRGHDRAGVAIDAVIGVRITYVAQNASGDPRNIDIVGMGRDLAHDEHHSRRRAGLARDACVRIVRKDLVENGVRYAVADLVGMSLSHGFRSKKSFHAS